MVGHTGNGWGLRTVCSGHFILTTSTPNKWGCAFWFTRVLNAGWPDKLDSFSRISIRHKETQ